MNADLVSLLQLTRKTGLVLVLCTNVLAPVARSQGAPKISVTQPLGPVDIDYVSDPSDYFILFRSFDLVSFGDAMGMKLGMTGVDRMSDFDYPFSRAFYRINDVSIATPIDTDGDGDDDLYELYRSGLFDPLSFDDAFRHPNPNGPGEGAPAAPGLGASGQPVATLSSMSAGWFEGVYPHSGESFRTETDLVVRGRVMDFVWTRKYRSQHGPNTAQGNGWDFSYNIYLEKKGADLVLHNGMGRADSFSPNGSGKWVRDEFFLNIEQNPNTSYTLTFPNSGTWNFDPIDGDPQDGKLLSIVDRNGNSMGFSYGGLGRLQTVTDDLGRNYGVSYNASGFIDSITDFTGRVVQYEYYVDPDPGGSDGDLKSARSPIVTAAVTGGSFPLGKTTVYTYSEGLSDDRLNHNLLSVTDPKGQVFLQYQYDPTISVADLNFDRVVQQTWGDPGDVINFTYVLLTPGPANAMSSMRVIVNDREGHVKELFYNDRAYAKMCREFTGFANPNLPTDVGVNRPAGALRVGDPTFFETRWRYNSDGLVTLVTYPEGNVASFDYDGANSNRRFNGNLLEVQRVPGPRGGDQATIVEKFEYEPGFGGCCGTNFVAHHEDGRGNVTLHAYDAAGNRLQTTDRLPSIVKGYTYNAFGQLLTRTLPDNGSAHRRVDSFSYYPATIQMGYLRDMTIDTGGENLVTTYEHDAVGNVTRTIDPSGDDSRSIYNELNQLVRSISRIVDPGSGTRFEQDVYYDANDKVVQIDVQTLDPLNPYFTTTLEYEILNRRVRTTQEIDDAPLLLERVTETAHDANRNRVGFRDGEAVAGSQPGNIVQYLYDERDLVYQVIRAPGILVPGGQATDQFDYDENGNVVRTLQGLEGIAPRERSRIYDGYERLVSGVDPQGNEQFFTYDANSNPVTERVEGELIDVPGSASNVRLSEGSSIYDAVDRLIEKKTEFFDTISGAPILEGATPDGKVVTTVGWSDASQVLLVTDDNLHATNFIYDTVNRRQGVSDAAGNSTTYQYDANSNMVQTVETDKSDGGAPDETFQTDFTYDDLDRLSTRMDSLGNQIEYQYDSRDNAVLVLDAMRPLPADPGNVVIHTFDGLNRLVATSRHLTADGTGTGALVGVATTEWEWDRSNRLAAFHDANGNVTDYHHDELNRLIGIDYADPTARSFEYDQHDTVVRTTDPNGTVTDAIYDLLNRPNIRAITLSPSVLDTTFEEFKYDGRSRVVSALDDDSLVTRDYDSLSRATTEVLNGQTTTTAYDGVGNQLQCVYPGARTITNTFDVLDRVKTVSDGVGLLGTYDYRGPYRVEQSMAGAGAATVQSDYQHDGLRRLIGATRRNLVLPGTPILDDRTFAWDQMSNNTQRVDLVAGITHDYSYDSVYQMVTAQQTASPLRTYNYDLAGNRTTVVVGAVTNTYTMNATTPNPADFQMNQYTSTPSDARRYDPNGNLRRIDFGTPNQRDLSWSFRDLFVRHMHTGTGVRTDYRYDTFGRRISKTVDVTGTSVETRFFYDGRFVIEEQDGTGTTTATYVKGAR